MEVKIKASNPFIKQLRSDMGWRLELDIDESQFDNIKDLPKYQDEILDITIKIKEDVNGRN